MNPVKGEVVMGQQRKIKQLRRELKQIMRKNQRTEAIYFPEEYEVSLVVTEEPVPDKDKIIE